jgi:murein DD-endopeptidase MepM/ murein hydrolase activator NlpD
VLLTAATIVIAGSPTAISHAATCWRPPVAAPIVDPFRPPACRWCAGNRGLEFGTPSGAVVRAVATGRVSFAGVVAATGYVVVRHADGRRVTYGGLAERSVGRGDLVVAGAPVGLTGGRLHFGLRDGTRYVDPEPFLGRLVRRPWLLPVDGGPAVPAPSPIVRCRRTRLSGPVLAGQGYTVRRPTSRLAVHD